MTSSKLLSSFFSDSQSADAIPRSIPKPIEGEELVVHQADPLHPLKLLKTDRNQCQTETGNGTKAGESFFQTGKLCLETF